MTLPNDPQLDVLTTMAESIRSLKRRVQQLESLEYNAFLNIIDVNNDGVLIFNSVVETVIYTVTIPGNTLSIDNVLHLLMIGSIRNESGAGATVRVRGKYGGTTILDSTISIPNGTSTTLWNLFALIFANNVTNSQRGHMSGIYNTTGLPFAINDGTSAIDSTVDQTLEFTIEFSAASALLQFLKTATVLKQYIAPS